MRYGRLKIIAKTKKKTKDNRFLYRCLCECGNYIFLPKNALVTGNTKSCGCLRKEIAAKNVLKVQPLAAKAASITNKKHGMRDTRFYHIWQGMKDRCLPNERNRNYGYRGITVSKEWNNFQNFMDCMYVSYEKHVLEHGEKNTTLDRVNVNGNYEAGNCRWATYKEQASNTQKNYKFKTEHGTTKS